MKFILTLTLTILFYQVAATQNSYPGDTSATEKVFEKVDIEASFPGGEAAWRRYLEKSLSRFNPADHGAPVSNYSVYIQFVVDKSGNITDVKALTNFGYGMEDEVVRMIRNGPHWTPAMQNGKPVKAYRKQPVTFAVIDEGFNVTMKEPYVLYTERENFVTIQVQKIKSEDIELTISQGTVTAKGDGLYSIHVNETGKAILEINSNKKKGRKVGAVYFVVKSKT